jgi:hypothetical protein
MSSSPDGMTGRGIGASLSSAKIVVVRALTLTLRGHRELVLENLALRQTTGAYHRTTRRRLRARDRLFWMTLARAWRNWRTALIVVQPDTVIRWHRDWLRRRWTRRSQPRNHGRPSIDPQVRALVREMATANPCCAKSRPTRDPSVKTGPSMVRRHRMPNVALLEQRAALRASSRHGPATTPAHLLPPAVSGWVNRHQQGRH